MRWRVGRHGLDSHTSGGAQPGGGTLCDDKVGVKRTTDGLETCFRPTCREFGFICAHLWFWIAIIIMDSSASPHAAPDSSRATDVRGGLFPLTEWSAISQARGEDKSRAVEGLRRLAVHYWRPLYLYLRKRGESHDDASDSVQGFFEFVFSSGFFEHVEREGGKFRSYLLRSLERWRSRRRVHEGAQKRGGGAVHVSLDGAEDLEDTADLADDSVSPEAVFDRQWAAEMVGRAVQVLHADYEKRGRKAWFDALAAALPGGGTLQSYAELATVLQTSEGAVKKAVFDLRAAFASRLREEIRATVRTNEDAEEELRHLVAVMSGR